MNTSFDIATTAWQRASTSETGECLVQNADYRGLSRAYYMFVDDGSDPNITNPLGLGGLLRSSQAISRGTQTGHIWVRSSQPNVLIAITQ